jgi:hypothetical protein
MRKGIWLVMLGLLPVCAFAVEWQDEWVADYENLYFKLHWNIDMDYDADGGDHIVWVDFDYDALNNPRYLYYTYVPDPRGSAPGPGFTELVARIGPSGVAMAVDRTASPAIPYIMYSDTENPAHVILASRVDGNWTSEIIRTFPYAPPPPREKGDEYNFKIAACSLAIGSGQTIHAAHTVHFLITTYAGGGFDNVYDAAYAKKEPGGAWECTDWLGTRELYTPVKQRKKYQQVGTDVVLGHENEPYVSLCEYEYNSLEPSYIFVATPDGNGGWDYDQVEEMSSPGGGWGATSVTSLGYLQPEAAQYPDLNLAYVTGAYPSGMCAYYLARIGEGNWNKDVVYEGPYGVRAFDVEVLYRDDGPAVAFAESGFLPPDTGLCYASLYACDATGVWSNILPVDREFCSGSAITAVIKPDGYTDLFYNWGYSETRGGNEFDASLLAAFELPGLDFASGPPADASRVPVLTRAFAAPNPAAQTLHIKFELSCPGVVKMAAYDLAGRKIHTEACAGVAGVNTLSIPVSHWPRGVYIYELSTSDSCKTGKAVVAR